jgi:uncharacterized protein (TIGR03435 family)
VIAAAVVLAAAAHGHEQKAEEKPQFEVASVKLNNGCQNNRGQEPMPAPGRLQIACVTLQNLIQVAYSGISNGKLSMQQLPITGAPGWLQSDFYSVAAKADGPAPVEVMLSQMLPALLEERFKLKLHRENREEPVYSMTVGKNGLKIQPAAEGSCVPIDLNHLPQRPDPGQPMPNYCGMQNMRFQQGTLKMDAHGVTMKEFAERIARQLDRPVVDKTGVAGMFDIHLEFSPDPSMRGFGGGGPGDAARAGGANPAAAEPAGPTVFEALQSTLGLKLTPDKGPVAYLVIDHVEKPTEN